jgi:hypothetical protein
MPSFSLVMLKAYPMLASVLFPIRDEDVMRTSAVDASEREEEDGEVFLVGFIMKDSTEGCLIRTECSIRWMGVSRGLPTRLFQVGYVQQWGNGTGG